MKLIDANLIIYWMGMDHEYRESATELMNGAIHGRLDAGIDVEVLQEVLHYWHKRGEDERAFLVFDRLNRALAEPFPVDATTMKSARQLLSRYPSLQTRDAVHAAVVVENRLEGIISADRGFDIIDGLTRFDPKELTA